jgi:hypothetical protein
VPFISACRAPLEALYNAFTESSKPFGPIISSFSLGYPLVSSVSLVTFVPALQEWRSWNAWLGLAIRPSSN